MKERLTVDELKNYELNILKFIDYVCKKYDIKYLIHNFLVHQPLVSLSFCSPNLQNKP